MQPTEQITKLFKAEYSNLVAVLCRFYGIESIDVAEDIISDTFLKAMKTWSHKGVPDQPKAWLRKVAVNQARDQFRRRKNFDEKVVHEIKRINNTSTNDEFTFSQNIIEDSQLNMIFAVCHPSIKVDARICLALRILSGFNIDEIAIALLTNKENINKKLYRAKQKLKSLNIQFNDLNKDDYSNRLDSVLRIIYLIYNEGYYSSISNQEIRQELCWEAMRLCIFLTKQKELDLQPVNALLALFCFHSSRLNSRIDQTGQPVLFDQQDRQLWNQKLIQQGEHHLFLASQGNRVSKYHLEAAIAYWHTTDAKMKWENILQLYNKLLFIEYSPITAMNRTYALAHANSLEEAIKEALKLKLKDNHLYYSLLAELHKMNGEHSEQIKYLKLAIEFAKKENEVSLLKRKLSEANDKQ